MSDTPRAKAHEASLHDLQHKTSELLTSLATEFLHSGLGYGDLIALAQQAFCDAAEQIVTVSGGRTTTSRVAVLTGMSRVQVSKVRRRGSGAPSPSYLRPRYARVVEGWRTDPFYCGQDGHPISIKRDGERSLGALCRKFSGDVPAKSMLDELLRRNLVVVNEEGDISLKQVMI